MQSRLEMREGYTTRFHKQTISSWNVDYSTIRMSADYDTDTLTTARSNRAASQRYYQLIPSRSLLSTAADAPGMLHRSPSGAKRKIKQKREGMARPSPFLPTSSSPSNSISPVPDDSASYRSLMDSGALQSILPEMPQTPPQPAPRLHSSLSVSTSALSDATHAAVPAHSKPTVEVHPMPIDEPKREKPPVPMKPKGLLVDHLNRSTSLTSLASPNINSTTSAFLSNLVASPSLLSLQNAYKNPDLGSQELRSLDERRNECISAVSHRLSTFEEKRLSIEEQYAQNERLGQAILDSVQLHDPLLTSRIRRHLESSWELLRLETKFRCQLDKLMECLKTGASDKSEGVFEELERIRRRMNDISLLRTTFQRREMDIKKSLHRFLSQEDYLQWTTYVERAVRLVCDERTVDGRIEDSRIHLRALHNARQSN